MGNVRHYNESRDVVRRLRLQAGRRLQGRVAQPRALRAPRRACRKPVWRPYDHMNGCIVYRIGMQTIRTIVLGIVLGGRTGDSYLSCGRPTLLGGVAPIA